MHAYWENTIATSFAATPGTKGNSACRLSKAPAGRRATDEPAPNLPSLATTPRPLLTRRIPDRNVSAVRFVAAARPPAGMPLSYASSQQPRANFASLAEPSDVSELDAQLTFIGIFSPDEIMASHLQCRCWLRAQLTGLRSGWHRELASYNKMGAFAQCSDSIHNITRINTLTQSTSTAFSLNQVSDQLQLQSPSTSISSSLNCFQPSASIIHLKPTKRKFHLQHHHLIT